VTGSAPAPSGSIPHRGGIDGERQPSQCRWSYGNACRPGDTSRSVQSIILLGHLGLERRTLAVCGVRCNRSRAPRGALVARVSVHIPAAPETPCPRSPRPHSSIVVDGPGARGRAARCSTRSASGRGLQQAAVGIASTWAMVTPCTCTSMGWRKPRRPARTARRQAVISIHHRQRRDLDGHRGHEDSLVSREVIADSIETVIGCQG